MLESVLELESREASICRNYVQLENENLGEEHRKINERLERLKRDRVGDQKKIRELERRLGFLKEEYNIDKTKLLLNSNVMVIH